MRNLMHVSIFVVVGLTVLVLSGCAVTSMGPGGASPGGLFTDITYPNMVGNAPVQIELYANDIKIVGPVEATGTSINVLGVVGTGNSGYDNLIVAATEKGADGVMNVTVDTQYTRVLFFYTKVMLHLRGTAFKYNLTGTKPRVSER